MLMFALQGQSRAAGPAVLIFPVQGNYSISILSELLRAGAMLCSVDGEGTTPLQILQTQPAKLNVMQFISLKCLAVKGKIFISKLKIFQTFFSGAEKVLYLRWCRGCWRNLSQLLQSPFLVIINLYI